MIGLIESGSTKAHWLFLENKTVVYEFFTAGLNPNSASLDVLNRELAAVKEGLSATLPVSHLFFYGAGCHGPAGAQTMESILKNHFPNSAISVKSDLVAAGIAIYGEGEGIVGILGTGSSCCYFRHGTIEHIAPSLGYILGDEGGGSSLGRELLRTFAYRLMPDELLRDFLGAFPSEKLVADLYKSSSPAGYLAQFVPFLVSNASHPFVQNLVRSAFDAYLKLQVSPMCEKTNLYTIGIVGSIGTLFSSILKPLARESGIEVATVIQYPISALVNYHSR